MNALCHKVPIHHRQQLSERLLANVFGWALTSFETKQQKPWVFSCVQMYKILVCSVHEHYAYMGLL